MEPGKAFKIGIQYRISPESLSLGESPFLCPQPPILVLALCRRTFHGKLYCAETQSSGKRRVYELDFAKLTGEPDVNVNPLPNHGKDVNAIDGELACRRKRDLSEVKFPMKAMFKVLFEAEVIQQEFLDPDLRWGLETHFLLLPSGESELEGSPRSLLLPFLPLSSQARSAYGNSSLKEGAVLVGPNGLTYGCHDLDPNREINSCTKNRSTNPTIWLQPEDGPKRQVGEVRVVVAD
ncbi:hypothetical protein ZIOFF_074431 (mitochondrion) [Zingiber officinale]|uniref:Uncharacterized protein n=1 Tax=Zingiber officinale TaxID=94328 RepID=A0A8J5BAA6_ZINOF|nr:hypothetical protein ZIOFF_074431 [Zingiber officinale]